MRTFWLFFCNEWKYVLRNPLFFAILILTPILLLTVSLLFIPSERVLETVKAGIYNEDQSIVGRYLVNFFVSFLKEDNLFQVKSREEAARLLDEGKIDALLVIPRGFTAMMLVNKPTELIYVPSGASLLESVTIYKLLKMVLAEIQYGAIIEIDLGERMWPSPDVPVPQLKIEGIFNNRLDYPDVMAPGVLAFVILSTMLIGITTSASREKDRGLIDAFRVTNANRWSFVFGKFSAYSFLGLIQTLILLFGSVWFFDIHVEGLLLLVGLFLILGMLSYLSLGLLISILSPNGDVSLGIAVGIVFLMFLGGGVFFPISQMPAIMQKIAPFLPITVLTESLRKIMITGRPIDQQWRELAISFGFLFSFLSASLISFKRSTR
ncbi:MAG TPA: ABC transporter permease [Thermotogota bacterium]|nr:ABC transporter permease [Thermotogota bacterium]